MSLLVFALFVLFRNRNHMLVCTAVFVGVEILLYQKIEIQSVHNAWHYINIVSILNISEIFSTYVNWGFGTYVFSVLSIVLFSLIVVTALLCIVAVMRYGSMHPVNRVSVLERFLKMLHMQYQKLFEKEPFVCKEIHKLLITAKGLWAVLALLVIAVYFSSQGQMTFTDRQKEWDETYQAHGGADWTYFQELIAGQNAELAEAEQNMQEKEALYKAGEIALEEYTGATAMYQAKKSEVGYTKEYREKVSYVEQVQEEYGVNAWLISDRGYEEMFGNYAKQRELILLVALAVVLVLVMAESFLLEYRTGMHAIVHSAANGRMWMLVGKIVACVLLTAGVTVLVYGVDALCLYRAYGAPFLQAPLLSLTFMREKAAFAGHFTIGGYLWFLAAVRMVVALATTAVALGTSRMIGKKGSRSLTPIVIVAVLVVLYMLHRATGVI